MASLPRAAGSSIGSIASARSYLLILVFWSAKTYGEGRSMRFWGGGCRRGGGRRLEIAAARRRTKKTRWKMCHSSRTSFSHMQETKCASRRGVRFGIPMRCTDSIQDALLGYNIRIFYSQKSFLWKEGPQTKLWRVVTVEKVIGIYGKKKIEDIRIHQPAVPFPFFLKILQTIQFDGVHLESGYAYNLP